METKLLVKGMVCNRCIDLVKQAVEHNRLQVKTVTLGQIVFDAAPSEQQRRLLEQLLAPLGFSLVPDRPGRLLSEIEQYIHEGLQHEWENGEHLRFPAFLEQKLNRHYSLISQLFSQARHITVEQYVIRKRIERAVLRLCHSSSTLTGIAYELGYKHISHFTRQFKAVTGHTPGHYRCSCCQDKTGKTPVNFIHDANNSVTVQPRA